MTKHTKETELWSHYEINIKSSIHWHFAGNFYVIFSLRREHTQAGSKYWH